MQAAETGVFSIKTDVFEGPLDLLLDLVERRKLLINDISLAEVTDEYMRQVSEMQERSLPGTAQFVQLAATLLLIKSKSLLPVLELTEEEETTIADLEERLKLYQIYRDAGKRLGAQFGKSVSHGRLYAPNRSPIFMIDKYTTVEALEEAMRSVLTDLPKKEEKPKVQIKSVISLEEMMDRLKGRIEERMKTTMRELLEGAEERHTIIVGFLAILESVKQGNILVAQVSRFEDIEIERHSFSVPRYFS